MKLLILGSEKVPYNWQMVLPIIGFYLPLA